MSFNEVDTCQKQHSILFCIKILTVTVFPSFVLRLVYIYHRKEKVIRIILRFLCEKKKLLYILSNKLFSQNMSSTTTAKLPKPQLRGLLRSYLRKHLTIAIIGGFCASYAWKYFVADPRKKAYAEFYKTYDGEKDYERMKDLGVLPPFPEIDKD